MIREIKKANGESFMADDSYIDSMIEDQIKINRRLDSVRLIFWLCFLAGVIYLAIKY